jgi:predicted nucleic acid-binding protein
MKGWLLDTNVISELKRPRPERRVIAFMEAQPSETLHVSSITLAEIRFGIERARNPSLRAELEAWLDHQVRPMFVERVLPVSEDVMLRWRLLVEDGRKKGHTYPQPDLIIAATALHHGLTVVSRDTADYARAGVPFVDPWRAGAR